MPDPIIATWRASLDCECPACHEDVDLMEAPDFWEGRKGLEIAEHNTPRSTNIGVTCPECGHDFTVNCEW